MKNLLAIGSAIAAAILAASSSAAEANSYTKSYPLLTPGPAPNGILGFDGSLGNLESVTIRIYGEAFVQLEAMEIVCTICDVGIAQGDLTVNGEIDLAQGLIDVKGVDGGHFSYPLRFPASEHFFDLSFDVSKTFSSPGLLSYFEGQYVFPDFSRFGVDLIHQFDCSTDAEPDCIYRTSFTGLDQRYGVDVTYTYGDSLAAPEPSMWAIMISGLGLAGVALRRRPVIAA